MVHGIFVIIILGIMGGIIAYMGDKLGSKIGKRKISLFGLRPKHTSILITIVTGVLVVATTIGIMGILSENVRIALFGLQQLQEETQYLTVEVDKKNKELTQSQKRFADMQNELGIMEERVKEKNSELDNLQYSYDVLHGELLSLHSAYNLAEKNLADAKMEISNLEGVKERLTQHVDKLQVLTDRLKEGIVHIREGEVLFRVGEVLSGALVRPGLKKAEATKVLSSFINDTNGLILRRVNNDDQAKEMIYVSRANFDIIAEEIANAQEPIFVRIVTAGNVIYGEPVLAKMEVSPYKLIYKKNEVILSANISHNGNAERNVLEFLKQVNQVAQAKGVISNPLTNSVGKISNIELVNAIEVVASYSGTIQIEAIASKDIYSEGPVDIRFRLTKL